MVNSMYYRAVCIMGPEITETKCILSNFDKSDHSKTEWMDTNSINRQNQPVRAQWLDLHTIELYLLESTHWPHCFLCLDFVFAQVLSVRIKHILSALSFYVNLVMILVLLMKYSK